MRCEDCGITVDVDPEHWKEHEGFCCDCFNQLWFGTGEVPDYKRNKLRPGTSLKAIANHVTYWEQMKQPKERHKPN